MRSAFLRRSPLSLLVLATLFVLIACSRSVPADDGPERMLPQVDDPGLATEGATLDVHEPFDPGEEVTPPSTELPHDGNPPEAELVDLEGAVEQDPRVAIIARFGGGDCESNDDCRVAGCNSELCVNADHGGMSTCDMRPEYACFRPPTTGCACLEGTCGWVPTPALVSCMDEAGAFDSVPPAE